MPSKLNIAFLWNHHQPYCKNSSGYYQLPRVRFHSTKDYLDLPLLIRKFPAIKQNVNLVPSLLLQIQDYTRNHARDNIGILTEIPAKQLSFENKTAILENFFSADVERIIKRYPRYYELYRTYNSIRHQVTRDKSIVAFSEQDFRDLQVWYNLAWIGEISRSRPVMRKLFKKARNFSEGDKTALLAETIKMMKEIVPLYKSLSNKKQLELSTSPMYYPILPLLIDNRIAQEANADAILPDEVFASPEDAEAQISRGLDYFESLFARRPAGMWPPEGCLSMDTAHMIAGHRIQWIATDETILAKSLHKQFHPNRIYQPHRLHAHNRSINIFFRDRDLSDTIGFVYNTWEEARAADDFVNRLHAIRNRIIDEKGEEAVSSHIASVIIDGENYWENYRENAKPFLECLYQRITEDPLINSCTFSDFLKQTTDIPHLYELQPGSWINLNFDTWIGGREDKEAWELLKQTRDFLVAKEDEGVLPQRLLNRLWDLILIAEGSDWCWWYGDQHVSTRNGEFDRLYRENLMQIYELAGEPIPPELYQSIKKSKIDQFHTPRATNFIKPEIDGKDSYFYEWQGAAVYEVVGDVETSMHQISRIIERLYVGFDVDNIYLRADFRQHPDRLCEYVLSIKTPRQITVVISPLRGVIEKFELQGELIEKTLLVPRFEVADIMEAAIEFPKLGLLAGDRFGFQVQVKLAGRRIEMFPNGSLIEFEVPDENFESREWSV